MFCPRSIEVMSGAILPQNHRSGSELGTIQKLVASAGILAMVGSGLPSIDVSEEADSLIHQLSIGEAVSVAGVVGVGAWIYNGGLENFNFSLPSVDLDAQPDEGIVARIEGTRVFENDIRIPITIVTKASTEVRINEAGVIDFFPFVDGSPSLGIQKVKVSGVGDVDIAIDGKVEIFRDEVDPKIIQVNISTFRTSRPRLNMSTIDFDGEVSRVYGVASTRDRADEAALIALQALVANEGCRVASQALIQQGVIVPVIEKFISEDLGDINYNPNNGDRIKVHMNEPADSVELATAEEFMTYYEQIEDLSSVDSLVAPQLGDNEALLVLEAIADEVDYFVAIDGEGNELTIEDLKNNQEFCSSNVLGGVVEIEIIQGEIFIGDQDTLLNQTGLED